MKQTIESLNEKIYKLYRQKQALVDKGKKKEALTVRQKYEGKCFKHIRVPVRDKSESCSKIFKLVSISDLGVAHCVVISLCSGDDPDGHHYDLYEITNKDEYDIDKPHYDYDLMYNVVQISQNDFDDALSDATNYLIELVKAK